MVKNFIIRKGKESSGSVLAGLVFFIVLYMQTRPWYVIPIMLLLITPILLRLIMLFRWTISFAVFLDMERQEIILNHTLFFRKKKISLKDIKEVDILNGNIVLYSSTPLSKCQRMVCKTKKTNDYTIRLEIIGDYERRQLMELLSTMTNKGEE